MTQEECAKIIAKNLKRIAYDMGKTQADIARDLKINKQTISSWFRGERIPRMEKIDMLCRYFGCNRSDIMEEYVKKEPEQIPSYLNRPDIYQLIREAERASPDTVYLVLEMLKRINKDRPD